MGSLEHIRSSSMVADKHPPKPEDVPEDDVPEDDVPEDDDGLDEETEERQEAIRYNRILLQANEEIDREIDVALDDLDRLQQDIVQHNQELYIQEEQLIAMILHERAKRVEFLSARHATLESEAEKSGSENGSGECSKK